MDHEVPPEERAAQARLLMTNPAFERALDGVHEDLYNEWERTPASDPAALQLIKLKQEALGSVIEHIERQINEGKVADFRRSRAP